MFISEGDALTAWAVRAVDLSSPQLRPVTALHALNMRFRLPCLVKAGEMYARNMVITACTFLSPETAAGDLGSIALANRVHLIEQSNKAHPSLPARGMPQPSLRCRPLTQIRRCERHLGVPSRIVPKPNSTKPWILVLRLCMREERVQVDQTRLDL